MFYLLIALIGTYLFGVLMGVIGLIHCIFNGRGVRALVIIVCLAGFTIATFYLSLPMLHMHGPAPDKDALSLAWIANIAAIIIFIRFAGRSLTKPNTEKDSETNPNIIMRSTTDAEKRRAVSLNVILHMNKSLKALIISSAIAFVATFAFSIITYEGVMYSPGITTIEMDTMSYSEASELTAQRAIKLSLYEFITSSTTTKYYWLNFAQLWLVIAVACFITFWLTERFIRD